MFATIKKELLLILRDPSGLILLLIMPAILIIVMAFVQDAPYKNYQKLSIKMPVVNLDKGKIGKKIIADLKQNGTFSIIDSINNTPINDTQLLSWIKQGDYSVGIIIPNNTTAVVVNKSNKLTNAISSGMGMNAGLPEIENADSTSVQLIFDPASQQTFRTSVTFALNQYIAQTQMSVLVDRLAKSAGDSLMNSEVLQAPLQTIYVKETPADASKQMAAVTNSVQHNVPAWTIFGMFMIVVPIAGNSIKEREEGSAVRLKLIPNSAMSIAWGKVLFYILLCMTQFLIMMLIGVFVLPLTGLPKLYLGNHPEALVVMALVTAFTATAYGLFIGTVFNTANQAMSLGAISVVLASAIGGLWVPVEILPKFMAKVAMVSPLYWSLEGLKSVMLRGLGVVGVALPIIVMLGIGIVFTLLTVFARKKYA